MARAKYGEGVSEDHEPPARLESRAMVLGYLALRGRLVLVIAVLLMFSV